MKPCLMFNSREMTIVLWKRNYRWSVWGHDRIRDLHVIASGDCNSFGQAFREARGWIRNNQNKVFG